MELIVTVAEFLVGDFAFGTAANLSLASHAVHQETLGVLYETLCLDRIAPFDYLETFKGSAGFKYTK
jgi:hypothetical protein